ncbi:MAG: VOC family protein [Actinomycetota bacterium]|nr:VOC family protein [Actinomycetota bacterium]
MEPTIEVDHCVVHVSDWERSNGFYRDVVGADVFETPSGYWAYRFGHQQLNLHGPGIDVGSNVARLPVMPGNSDLCFVWPGAIEDAVEHLKEHGVEVETGPIERFGARGIGTSVYFRDPDGSLLEFISYD